MIVFLQLFLADFKTPLGTFVILGIHVLPIWLYAHYAGVFTHTLVIPGVLNYFMIAFLSGGRAMGSVVEVSYWSIVVNKKALGGKDGRGEEDIYAHGDIGYTWVMKLVAFLSGRRAVGSVVGVSYWSVVVNEKSPGWGREKRRGKGMFIHTLIPSWVIMPKIRKRRENLGEKREKNWEKRGKIGKRRKKMKIGKKR